MSSIEVTGFTSSLISTEMHLHMEFSSCKCMLIRQYWNTVGIHIFAWSFLYFPIYIFKYIFIYLALGEKIQDGRLNFDSNYNSNHFTQNLSEYGVAAL